MSENISCLYVYSYKISEIKTRRTHFKKCCKCTIFLLAYISLWGNRLATLSMTLIHSLCFAVQILVYNLVSPVSFE